MATMDDPQDGAGELRVPAHVSFPEPLPGFVTISLFARAAIRNGFHDERLHPVSPGLRPVRVPLAPTFPRHRRFRRPGLTAGAVK